MGLDFKIGDVVLFNYSGFFNKFIKRYNLMRYGFSKATHVGIISKVGKENVEIYEALNQGFVKQNYERWWLDLKIKEGIIILKSSKKRLTYVENNCEKYLGRGYSWFDIVRIFYTYIIGFNLGFSCSKHLICSEAVSRILYDSSNKKLNLAEEFDKPYDLITPMDIFLSKQLHGKKS